MPTLIKRFQAEASAPWICKESAPKLVYFKMPRCLFETLCETRRRGLTMAHGILAVLADEEHRLLMEFGRRACHRLPDLDAIAVDMARYARFLESIDPKTAVPAKGAGDSMLVPPGLARDMKEMLRRNDQVLQAVMAAMLKTGYLGVFTDAKNKMGVPYGGRTAMAEVMNLLFAAKVVTMDAHEALALNPGSWPLVTARPPGEGPPPREEGEDTPVPPPCLPRPRVLH